MTLLTRFYVGGRTALKIEDWRFVTYAPGWSFTRPEFYAVPSGSASLGELEVTIR